MERTIFDFISAEPDKEAQCGMILNHMKSGRSITALEAVNLYRIMRLASRIYDLKQRGYDIRSDFEKNERTGKRYKVYWLNPARADL